MGTGLFSSHKLRPTSTYAHPIPSAHFPGMLVHACHSQTPWCHPDHVCRQFEMAYQLVHQARDSLPVSTSDNLIWSSPLLLPFLPLAPPANTLVSLCLQLIKATVLTECSVLSFQRALSATVMSTDVSQVGVALFPSFSHFCSHMKTTIRMNGDSNCL